MEEINQKNKAKSNKSKSWFFEKINKIDSPLVQLTRNGEAMNQQNQRQKGNPAETSDTQDNQRLCQQPEGLEEREILVHPINQNQIRR